MGLDMGPAVGSGGRICIGFGSERARPVALGGGLLTSRAFATPRSFEPVGLRVLGDAFLIGDLMPARTLAANFSGEKVSESSLGRSSFISPSALRG